MSVRGGVYLRSERAAARAGARKKGGFSASRLPEKRARRRDDVVVGSTHTSYPCVKKRAVRENSSPQKTYGVYGSYLRRRGGGGGRKGKKRRNLSMAR